MAFSSWIFLALVGINACHITSAGVVNGINCDVKIRTCYGEDRFKACPEQCAKLAKDSATVDLVEGTDPNVQGRIYFIQGEIDTVEQLIITGNITGLKKGQHGLSINTLGDLTNQCNDTLEHWNPESHEHGSPDDTNHHLGDLGNIQASDSGTASVFITSKDLFLTGWGRMRLLDRSLVVYEKQDDLGKGGSPLSKITGNTGKRLACGKITSLNKAQAVSSQ